MKDWQIRFNAARKESELHFHHLNHAFRRTSEIYPLSEQTVKNLSNDQIAFTDQLIFRFTKLQDCMGNRLFHSGLALLGEPVDDLTMLDRLHLLERLSIMNDATEWLQLRELRNELTHEYPDADQIKAEALNALIERITYLKSVFKKFTDFVDSKLG
ncbi:MAG: hypothetical protein RIC30_05065 [Marinoscillum sp.]|uniref:hypothetical protein n=1 Tax=Marinoscillum sp. TaxID=2024838 RepID=UPI0033032AB2